VQAVQGLYRLIRYGPYFFEATADELHMNQRTHATGLRAFGKEELKTSEQVAEFMKKEFPGRDSKIFEYPNSVLVVLTVG